VCLRFSEDVCRREQSESELEFKQSLLMKKSIVSLYGYVIVKFTIVIVLEIIEIISQ
jgi:hypothetical protein